MYPTDDFASQPLADTVVVLRRRWKLIALVTTMIVAGVVGFGEYKESTAAATYEAVHTLATNPSRAGNSELTIRQTAEVLNSSNSDLAIAAEARIGSHPGTSIEAQADDVQAALRLRTRGSDPEQVASVADTYAEVLIETLGGADREIFEEQLASQREQVEKASQDLEITEFALSRDPEDERSLAERDSALNAYRAAIDALNAIQRSGVPEPTFRTLTSAVPRKASIGGFTGLGAPRRGAAALVLGLMLGVGLAFLREALDRRLKTSADAAEAFGVPVLSEIPDAGKTLESNGLAPVGSIVTEAYRRVRTILELERKTTEPATPGGMVVLVVSPGPGEGKTTSVAHLSRALGEVGHKTLAISADFRRPKLHQPLGVNADAGLVTLLNPTAGATGSDLIQPSHVTNVSVVTAGKGTHDPTELIRVTKSLVREARSRFDYIVIDTSPLLSTSDALDLVSSADSVIAVAKFRDTGKGAAELAGDMLRQTNAPLLGVLVTGVHARDGYGAYYYYDAYVPRPDSGSRRQAREGV